MLVFDLDDNLEADWTEDLGQRSFRYDVFISHNQHDESARLAERLAECGVRVWHDGHADMRDRKVRSKVAQALMASRYIVVAMGQSFRNSPWVCAEYRPGLSTENQTGLARVIGFKMHPEAKVPGSLESSPMFNNGVFDEFVLFLKMGNLTRVPLADAVKAAAYEFESIAQSCKTSQPVEARIFSKLLESDIEGAASNLKLSKHEASQDEYSMLLFALEQAINSAKDANIPPLNSDDGEILLKISISALKSRNLDNRANGLKILATLADQWNDPRTRRIFGLALCLEESSELVSSLLEIFPSTLLNEARHFEGALDLIAVKTPQSFREEGFGDFLPHLSEPVRVRIAVKTALGELSRHERMLLAQYRLNYISSIIQNNGPTFDQVSGPIGEHLGISELEVLLRDISSDVLGVSPMSEGFPKDVLDDQETMLGVLNLYEAIVALNSPQQVQALIAANEYMLDWFIFPLMLFNSTANFWPTARNVANEMCDILSPKLKTKATWYRTMIAEIDSGQPIGTAKDKLLLQVALG